MARSALLAVAGAGTAALAGALGLAIATLVPPEHPGLPATVAEAMPRTGVRHPVTAVLLDFRAYDTLLEIAVLLSAWIAVLAAAPRPRPASPPPELLLDALLRLLAPLLVVFAGYLLWRGEHAPGGAFQAGAMLAAGAVLASLAGRPIRVGRAAVALSVAGLAAFLGVGLSTLVLRGAFLDYPPAAAGGLILGIEAAAMVSIAAVLALLFDPELAR
jgi:multisubunit Na+/H+ antiporter MnhB subunit